MIQKTWNLDRINDKLQLEAIKRQQPLNCVLELTYRCNFRCKMCYVHMTDAQASSFGRMHTVSEWLDLAQQMRDAGVLNLTITGGECTLYPGFSELYEQLAQMGFVISIMSNAGSWSDAVRESLRRYPPSSVGVTLYGGCAETYEKVTGDSNGFKNTVENLHFLKSIGIPLKLCFTIIRQNVLDYPKVGLLCRKLGVPYTLITDITPHRYSVDFSNALSSRLTPAERACIALHSPDEVKKAMDNAGELEKELEYFQMPAPPAVTPLPVWDSCMSSQIGCAICWNGDMQPCISLRGYRCVHPFETGFETAWATLKAQYKETFRRSSTCQTCDMASECLHNCAGRRLEGTGSPFEPDPYTCQYTYLLKKYKAKQNSTGIPSPPNCFDTKAGKNQKEGDDPHEKAL